MFALKLNPRDTLYNDYILTLCCILPIIRELLCRYFFLIWNFLLSGLKLFLEAPQWARSLEALQWKKDIDKQATSDTFTSHEDTTWQLKCSVVIVYAVANP